MAGFEGGVVRIRLNAPPVEGQANEALVRFLAKALGVPKSRIALVAGGKGRNKIVRVDGITREALLAGLDVWRSPHQGKNARTGGPPEKEGEPEGFLG